MVNQVLSWRCSAPQYIYGALHLTPLIRSKATNISPLCGWNDDLLHQILRYAQEDTLSLGAQVYKRHFIRAKNPAPPVEFFA